MKKNIRNYTIIGIVIIFIIGVLSTTLRTAEYYRMKSEALYQIGKSMDCSTIGKRYQKCTSAKPKHKEEACMQWRKSTDWYSSWYGIPADIDCIADQTVFLGDEEGNG